MRLPKVFDYYRDFRFNRLTTPAYRHCLLLLYWPVYGLFFLYLERIRPDFYRFLTGRELIFTEMHCPLDDLIPFSEWFTIPYYFWFAFIIGMLIYSFFADIPAFRVMMWYIILSYSATTVIYFVFPNMQVLRPAVIDRENVLVAVVENLYDFDTNTNVFPSIHVSGALAVGVAGMHSKTLRGIGWKLFFLISTAVISISTVFMKQHSILDVFGAFALFAVCYPLVIFVFAKPSRQYTSEGG